jgi:proline iminopeptidase
MKNLFVFFLVLSLGAMNACTKKADFEAGKAKIRTGVVTANGIEFNYFIEGTGIPCMVVGDALTPSRALSRRLRDHFQFFFVNSRMTTPEEKVGNVANLTMDTLVDDIEAARHARGLGKVCMLGHSIAGILALEYARKHPQNTSHVIMHGTPPYVNEQFRTTVGEFWKTNASEERKRILSSNWASLPEDTLSKMSPSAAAIFEYVTNAPRYFHDPTYDPAWLLEGAYWNVKAWNHLFTVIMVDYDIAKGQSVDTPVFLAIGRDDYQVPYSLWDNERTKLPRLSYNLFEKSGHYPMLEEQELFDKKLLEWIRSQQ